MDPTFSKTKKTKIAWIDSPTPIRTHLLLRLVFGSIVVAMFLRINMDFNECLVVSIAIFLRNLNKINELWFGLDLLTWAPATIKRWQDFAHRCSHDPMPSPENCQLGCVTDLKLRTTHQQKHPIIDTWNSWYEGKKTSNTTNHPCFMSWPYIKFSFERMEIPPKSCMFQQHEGKPSNQLVLGALHILNLNLGKSPLPSVHNEKLVNVDESPDQMDLNRLFRWGHMQPILVLTLVLKKFGDGESPKISQKKTSYR